MSKTINVTVWNEFRHEKSNDAVKALYPNGIHAVIAGGLGQSADISCRLASLDEPEHGLTQEVVDTTDVLIWWGHCAHAEVNDEIVKRVQKRVLEGMGLIVLHSGHFSKIFKALLGTNCSLKWREVAEKGGSLAFGTDSHRRDEVGVFTYHEKVLSEAGMAMSDFHVFNRGSLG